ncbi:MAG: hypothetical protein ACN6O7_20500 [Sphingobacterium sp.]
MELIEIKDLFAIDYGAPSPTILSNDNELFIAFYAQNSNMYALQPTESNINYEQGIIALKFKMCIKYTFGMPGNETLHGHPYGKLGMESCSFYELRDSDFIKSQQEIEKVHSYYNEERWKTYKHYILTFHDNMFECIAQDFEIRHENRSLYSQASEMLKQVSIPKI